MSRTILQLTSNQGGGSYPLTLSWPTPVTDGLGAYDAGQPTRLTIQEDGDYIVYACIASDGGSAITSALSVAVLKNGSESYTGRGRTIQSRGTDPGIVVGVICQTAPIPLVAGDYLQVSAFVSAPTSSDPVLGTADMPTEVMLYKVPALRGALTYLTSDNTTVNADNVPAWDAELYDTDSIWSSGAATDFVMPATGYASGTLNFTNLDGTQSPTGRWGGRWEKGGVDQGGKRVIASNISNVGAASVYCGPIIVAASDVLQAKWRSVDTSYTQSSASGISSAAVEFHTRDCVIAGLSGDINAIDTTGGYTISWTSEIADDVAGFSTGTNPSRITSPGGWVQVGVSISITGFVSFGADHYCELIHYNAAGTLQRTYNLGLYSGTDGQQLPWTRHLETTAGDYFVARLTNTSADTSINILALGSRFWMEVFPPEDTDLPLGPALATIDLDAEADAFDFVIGLSGSATVSLDAEADLFTAIGLSGASQITLDAEADLQLGTVLLGSAEITLDAAADLGVGTPLGLTTATLSLLVSGDLTVETRLVGATTVTLDAEADLVLGTDLGDTDATLNIFAREAGGAARAGAFFLLF